MIEAEMLSISLNSFSTNFWIGLSRMHDGSFSWVDGSAFNFEHWADGEPNGEVEGEDCVEMYTSNDAQWNDVICSDHNPFVCMTKRCKVFCFSL